MPSLTVENYIKAIYQISVQQDKKPVTTGQLATALGVAPGTVTSMLKTLNTAGLARHTPYEGVSLSRTGQVLALRMIRRHRLIEQFLVQTLSMNWDEVHDEAELTRALKLKPSLLGINNRNLRDFSVSLNTTLQLCKMAPDNCLVVSESGIYTPEDLRLLANADITTVLVGESLMRQQDLSEATKTLLS